jgi:hypothetical protein
MSISVCYISKEVHSELVDRKLREGEEAVARSRQLQARCFESRSLLRQSLAWIRLPRSH